MVELVVAQEHYAEHEGKGFYDSLLEFITGGPLVGAGRRGAAGDRRVPSARRRHRSGGEGRHRQHPRRLRPGDPVQPGARLRFAGVRRPGDRAVVPEPVTGASTGTGAPDPAAGIRRRSGAHRRPGRSRRRRRVGQRVRGRPGDPVAARSRRPAAPVGFAAPVVRVRGRRPGGRSGGRGAHRPADRGGGQPGPTARRGRPAAPGPRSAVSTPAGSSCCWSTRSTAGPAWAAD